MSTDALVSRLIEVMRERGMTEDEIYKRCAQMAEGARRIAEYLATTEGASTTGE